MQEYRLYLNDIEFYDIPEAILTGFEKTLIRDSGISNDEQIFRDKCELELEFYGDAYNYICHQRINNICNDIDFRLERLCNSEYVIIFIGTIKQLNNINYPKKCILKSVIYDNSYSAMIRERQDNKFFLNLNKSINNTDILNCPNITINAFKQIDILGTKKIATYEVFEVFKYLIRILTNDKVQVVSDIFTSGILANKYSICTGAMLRLGVNSGFITNSFNNTYLIPELSYKELFIELRKCFRLYQSIEYDNLGNPILRIENESYFYKNNVIFNLDDLPHEIEESYYQDEMYSDIRVGSVETIPESEYFVPNIRLYSWSEENYNNCTNCNLQKTLDLVNDWIIDSNVIFDAINGTDSWDRNIFIIELENNTTPKKYKEDINQLPNLYQFANNYYNESLNNYNKLINWSGGIPECIVNFYNQEKCNQSNYDTADDIKIQHDDFFNGFKHIGITNTMLRFNTELCDSIYIQNNDYNTQNCNIFDNSPPPPYVILENNITGLASVISIPFTGQYNIDCLVNFTNILQVGGGNNIGTLEEYKIELKILIFTGGVQQLEGGGNVTPIEIVSSYDHAGNFDDNFNQTLQVTTGLININAGAIVVPIFRIKTEKLGIGVNAGDALQVNAGYLNIIDQNYNFIEDMPQATEVQKLIKYKLNLPLCFDNLQNIFKNKYGVIKINGIDTWIKELKYIDNKISEFTLITYKTLCNVCN